MNGDDDLSESEERDIGAMGAIKANYIEKIIVSTRFPETDVSHNNNYAQQTGTTPQAQSQPQSLPTKTVNLVPQLSRKPIFSENGRPQSSSSLHPNHNSSPSHLISTGDPAINLVSEGKSVLKGKSSPPRPPSSATPSRVGTAARPKTSNRVVTAPGTNNQPQLLSQTQPNPTATAINTIPAITNVSPVKQANIENRILIRLANMLPSDSEAGAGNQSSMQTNGTHGISHSDSSNTNNNSSHFGKLPESRNMLLRLNHDLDEIMTDIRNWSLELDRFNFGDMQSQEGARNKDFISGPSMDNNALVFDQVIAELSGQASKKVVRIKKMYRNQMHKLKKQYEKHVSELKGQADALSSKLFESQLRGDDLTDALQTAGGETPANATGKENDALHQHQRLVKVLREEQDSMQEILLRRLEAERKMTLEKFAELDKQLKDSQAELRIAKETIAELTSKLSERENSQIQKDREVVAGLTENLKALIKMSQATMANK